MKKKLFIFFILTILFVLAIKKYDTKPVSHLINVPLENQNSDEKLGNGCEITALSMLLKYEGYKVNKNELAEILEYVPVKIDANTYGNPRDGFVGNIYGGLDAMGVFVEPIAKVAKTVVKKEKEIVFGEEIPFSKIEDQVKNGNPVWVLTTVDYQIPQPDDLFIWQTTKGEVQVNRLCHSVVITGVDDTHVYVNDPYGKKNKSVPKSRFIKNYKSMNEQALYFNQ